MFCISQFIANHLISSCRNLLGTSLLLLIQAIFGENLSPTSHPVQAHLYVPENMFHSCPILCVLPVDGLLPLADLLNEKKQNYRKKLFHDVFLVMKKKKVGYPVCY